MLRDLVPGKTGSVCQTNRGMLIKTDDRDQFRKIYRSNQTTKKRKTIKKRPKFKAKSNSENRVPCFYAPLIDFSPIPYKILYDIYVNMNI